MHVNIPPPFRFALAYCLFFLVSLSGHAQNAYVGRYDLYTGFSDLYTPGLNGINQIGFHLQAGLNTSKRLSYGFDYSVQNGSSNLTTGIATATLRRQLAAERLALRLLGQAGLSDGASPHSSRLPGDSSLTGQRGLA